MNAFDEAAENIKAYEREVMTVWNKDGTSTPISTLTFPKFLLNPPLTIPVTHTQVNRDFQLLGEGGFSSLTAVERCEFRAELVPNNLWTAMAKGVKCTLTENTPSGPVTHNLQLWGGGPMEGNRIFRFMLVSAFFKG